MLLIAWIVSHRTRSAGGGDLLLLDINMPRMTGLEVLEWKRANADAKDLPAVILSSSTAERDRDEASRLGARGYLVKPATMDALVQQVKVLESELLAD